MPPADGDIAALPLDYVLREFQRYPEAVPDFVKGKVKNDLQEQIADELADIGLAGLELADLDETTGAFLDRLIGLFEQLDQAFGKNQRNQPITSAAPGNEKEVDQPNQENAAPEVSDDPINEKVDEIDAYIRAKEKVAKGITVEFGSEKETLDAYIYRVFQESGVECNNVFASQLLPQLRMVRQGKPIPIQLVEFLAGLGIRLNV